jgi:hypothetical protein
MMTAQQLRDQIRQAFPATPFDGDITRDNEECRWFQEELHHKRWDEISTAFLDATGDPVLLTPAAFVAFLPAYLFRALDNLSPHSQVAELTVYTLCPIDRKDLPYQATGNWLLERAKLMSPSQVRAIRAFLQFAQENLSDGEWFRSSSTDALESIWC